MIRRTTNRVDYTDKDLSELAFLDEKLADCDFSGADLRKSAIDQCIFKNCILDQVDLSGSQITASWFTGSMCHADLRHSIIKRVDFRGCDLRGANFSGAIITDCHFDATARTAIGARNAPKALYFFRVLKKIIERTLTRA